MEGIFSMWSGDAKKGMDEVYGFSMGSTHKEHNVHRQHLGLFCFFVFPIQDCCNHPSDHVLRFLLHIFWISPFSFHVLHALSNGMYQISEHPSLQKVDRHCSHILQDNFEYLRRKSSHNYRTHATVALTSNDSESR